MVVDSASDVVAAGAAFGVVKLAGSTGTEVWRTTPLGGDAKSLAVDSAGDVVVGGTSTHDFTVVKLSGSTGAELWRVTLTGNSPSFDDVAYAVAVDPSGDVVAAGYVFSYPPGNEMVTIKLAGSTGTEVWRHAVAVPTVVSNGDFFAVALAIEPSSGDVITAGGSFITGGYSDTISTDYGSPIGGREAWSGDSGGYIDRWHTYRVGNRHGQERLKR